MAEHRERPILFSGPMVRAILEGRKTQTRRVVSPRLLELFGEPSNWEPLHYSTWRAWSHHTRQKEHFASPLGRLGDRLWGRETWALEQLADDGERVVWQADRAAAWRNSLESPYGEIFYLESRYTPERWRPSIHMPRWASRLLLDLVAEVRVERLHDISEADALAEGVWCEHVERGRDHCGVVSPSQHWRYHFQRLWKEVYGPESWDANRWVWVGEFRRLEGTR